MLNTQRRDGLLKNCLSQDDIVIIPIRDSLLGVEKAYKCKLGDLQVGFPLFFYKFS